MNSYDLSNLTVLVVEKYASMRTLFRQVLRQFGIPNIYDASNPKEGFVRFKDYGPDIVFIDWGPDFDGLGLVERIRRSGNSPDPFVAVIMVTANTEMHHIELARDAGVSEYLAKPVSAKGLYDRIVAVVENDRQFVRTKSFIGPDRRRLDRPYAGQERRAENRALATETPPAEAGEPDGAPDEKKSDANSAPDEPPS